MLWSVCVGREGASLSSCSHVSMLLLLGVYVCDWLPTCVSGLHLFCTACMLHCLLDGLLATLMTLQPAS
jgi:hypothetical protein